MKFINPPNWKSPKGYNNGVLCPPNASLLFIAGQVGWNENEKMEEGFLNQFRKALQNVVTVVETAGGNRSDLARLIFYVTDKKEYSNHLKEVGLHYRDVVGKHFPVMTLVEVKSLLEENALIEIEAIAVISNQNRES